MKKVGRFKGIDIFSDPLIPEGILYLTSEKISDEYHAKLEDYVKLKIQPKPRWLPSFLWKIFLKRLLVLEEFKI
jgi:hypothetical protein